MDLKFKIDKTALDLIEKSQSIRNKRSEITELNLDAERRSLDEEF